MFFWIGVILFFSVMHLLICAWIRFDARQRGINEHRWYKFSLYLPAIGIIFYGLTKRSLKASILFFALWVFPAVVILLFKLMMVIRAERSGG